MTSILISALPLSFTGPYRVEVHPDVIPHLIAIGWTEPQEEKP